jgi:hypothetical protein
MQEGLKSVPDSRRCEGMEKGVQQNRWYPTTTEVQRILDEMKPLIAAFARRDKATMAREMVRTGPGIA